MSIEIITNSVWGDAARILATNGIDNPLADQEGIENLTGGPRHLYYTGAGMSDLRAAYVNKDGGLAADRCVIVRADRNTGHGLGIYRWPTYPGAGPTVLFGATAFVESLVGPRSQDFVLSFAQHTDQEAFGIELNSGSGGAYAKVVQQVFFGTAFPLRKISGLTRRPLPKLERIVLKRKSYMVREVIKFTAGKLSREDIDDLQRLYKLTEEPFFLYDSEGIQIRDKLVYGFFDAPPGQAIFDDLHSMPFTFNVLEYWA